jgi:hypothetical protein
MSPYFYGAFLLAVPMYFAVGGMGGCVAVDGHIHHPVLVVVVVVVVVLVGDVSKRKKNL